MTEWKTTHTQFDDQWHDYYYPIDKYREWLPIDDFELFAQYIAKDNIYIITSNILPHIFMNLEKYVTTFIEKSISVSSMISEEIHTNSFIENDVSNTGFVSNDNPTVFVIENDEDSFIGD